MTKMHEMTNDVEAVGSTQPYRPIIYINDRWRLDAFGRYWSPRSLVVLLAVVVAVVVALILRTE